MHSDEMIEAFKLGYKRVFSGADDVLKRVEEIRRRGRYL
jgi:tRNA A-37 threonylcarbamoyl transferase component Bud32